MPKISLRSATLTTKRLSFIKRIYLCFMVDSLKVQLLGSLITVFVNILYSDGSVLLDVSLNKTYVYIIPAFFLTLTPIKNFANA